MVWDPWKLQADLKSLFGFDELEMEETQNFLAELNKVCISVCF
jgi:hypothetical protein